LLFLIFGDEKNFLICLDISISSSVNKKRFEYDDFNLTVLDNIYNKLNILLTILLIYQQPKLK